MDEKAKLHEFILSLTAELEEARRALASAEKQRLYAQEIENQLAAEVEHLAKLIEIRRKRLGPSDDERAVAESNQPRLALRTEEPVEEDSSVSEGGADNREDDINRVRWIESLVKQSGVSGVSPPEVSEAARRAGVKMHKNYPYVVLKKLIEKGLIVKRRGRYYKKEQ